MPFDLASIVKRQRRPRRNAIVLRDIAAPAMFATDLYRAAYLPAVRLWQAATEPIIAQYETSLAQLVRDSAEDLQNQIERTAQDFDRLLISLTPELRRWALRVEQWQRGKWRGAVLSATGVDLQTIIGPEGVRETLESVIGRNVALIRDISAQAQGRISDAVFRGLTERRPTREVAKQVREAVAMSRRRSVNIAADQSSKITNALAEERRREAGIDVWKWRHSGKAHPRIIHLERNGNLYGDTAAAQGRQIDGKPVRKPPDDRPGQLPWCGCRSQSVVVFD